MTQSPKLLLFALLLCRVVEQLCLLLRSTPPYTFLIPHATLEANCPTSHDPGNLCLHRTITKIELPTNVTPDYLAPCNPLQGGSCSPWVRVARATRRWLMPMLEWPSVLALPALRGPRRLRQAPGGWWCVALQAGGRPHNLSTGKREAHSGRAPQPPRPSCEPPQAPRLPASRQTGRLTGGRSHGRSRRGTAAGVGQARFRQGRRGAGGAEP